jgi:hypothetical protein
MIAPPSRVLAYNRKITVHGCSGSFVRAAQVSSSAASGLAHSSKFGTRDKGQGTVEVSMGGFPTCLELEAMDNRNAEDGAKHEERDVYVRYVQRTRKSLSASRAVHLQ